MPSLCFQELLSDLIELLCHIPGMLLVLHHLLLLLLHLLLPFHFPPLMMIKLLPFHLPKIIPLSTLQQLLILKDNNSKKYHHQIKDNPNNPNSQSESPPLHAQQIPSCIPRHSAHLQKQSIPGNHATALLTEYSSIHNMHDLLPADFSFDNSPSLDDVLAMLIDGSIEPTIDPDNDPLWAQAIASDKHEYWIAGGCNELKSLCSCSLL